MNKSRKQAPKERRRKNHRPCDRHAFNQTNSSRYRIGQFFPFLDFFGLPPPRPILCCESRCSRISISCPTAVLTANSKTSSTPCISLLLHSTYMAPIRLATAWPCSGVTGVRPWVLRRSMQDRLARRSDLRPTRMRGVVGQKCRTSGYHCRSGSDRLLREIRSHEGCLPCP